MSIPGIKKGLIERESYTYHSFYAATTTCVAVEERRGVEKLTTNLYVIQTGARKLLTQSICFCCTLSCTCRECVPASRHGSATAGAGGRGSGLGVGYGGVAGGRWRDGEWGCKNTRPLTRHDNKYAQRRRRWASGQFIAIATVAAGPAAAGWRTARCRGGPGARSRPKLPQGQG